MAPQRYIVVFKNDVPQEEVDKHAAELDKAGGKVTSKYDSVLKGFAGEIPDSYLQSLQSLQGGVIDYIEADGPVTTQ